MHVVMHIDEMSSDRYAAGFTIHESKDTAPVVAPVELEQAYPNRLDALKSLMDAIETHMQKHYGLGANEVTVNEK